MIKLITLVALSAATALGGIGVAHADAMADRYFSGEAPKLTDTETAAIELSKRWEAGSSSGVRPVAGPNGSIRFLFGAQQPSIVCAVLQVCDLALQPGEQIKPNGVHLGDSVRWQVEPAVSGSGAAEIYHVIIKPLDVGLDTSLAIATNRRFYHIKLRSHRTEYMPQVSFTYPEDALAKWDAIQTREIEQRESKTTEHGEYMGELSFEYDVDGAASWKPIRIYNDGRKTTIEMPKIMGQTEAPSLLVVRKDGGIFSDEETAMVNYRVAGDRYIVDSVFEKAILIAGVGSNQDRVTITRRK